MTTRNEDLNMRIAYHAIEHTRSMITKLEKRRSTEREQAGDEAQLVSLTEQYNLQQEVYDWTKHEADADLTAMMLFYKVPLRFDRARVVPRILTNAKLKECLEYLGNDERLFIMRSICHASRAWELRCVRHKRQ